MTNNKLQITKLKKRTRHSSFVVFNSAGFTLLEMVVSIGLFSTLIIAAAGVTLSVSKAQIKAQNIQASLDNIRFSLELITKEMRTGTGWALTSICAPQGSEISFTTSLGEKRVYFLDSSSGAIMRAKVVIGGAECSNPAKVKPFTAEEVLVERFNFSFTYGQIAGSSDGQPRATITLKVTSRSPKEELQSSMDLQTTVVQRLRDL